MLTRSGCGAQRVVWSEELAVAAGWEGAVERVLLEDDSTSMAVLPLWIAVHQHLEGGPATCDAPSRCFAGSSGASSARWLPGRGGAPVTLSTSWCLLQAAREHVRDGAFSSEPAE